MTTIFNTQLNKPKATQVLSVKSYQPVTQPVGSFKCYFMHGWNRKSNKTTLNIHDNRT